jgi:hypothetical protein
MDDLLGLPALRLAGSPVYRFVSSDAFMGDTKLAARLNGIC